MTNLLELPSELIYRLYSYLDNQSLVSSASVCSRLLEVIKNFRWLEMLQPHQGNDAYQPMQQYVYTHWAINRTKVMEIAQQITIYSFATLEEGSMHLYCASYSDLVHMYSFRDCYPISCFDISNHEKIPQFATASYNVLTVRHLESNSTRYLGSFSNPNHGIITALKWYENHITCGNSDGSIDYWVNRNVNTYSLKCSVMTTHRKAIVELNVFRISRSKRYVCSASLDGKLCLSALPFKNHSFVLKDTIEPFSTPVSSICTLVTEPNSLTRKVCIVVGSFSNSSVHVYHMHHEKFEHFSSAVVDSGGVRDIRYSRKGFKIVIKGINVKLWEYKKDSLECIASACSFRSIHQVKYKDVSKTNEGEDSKWEFNNNIF